MEVCRYLRVETDVVWTIGSFLYWSVWFGKVVDSARRITMKIHREFTWATSCTAILAVNLSGPVFAAAFMKLGDIKGEVRQLPPETECHATIDGQYQCKNPKANAPLTM